MKFSKCIDDSLESELLELESQQKADQVQQLLDTKQAEFIAKLHKYKQRNIRLKAELQVAKDKAKDLEIGRYQAEDKSQNNETFLRTFQALASNNNADEMTKMLQEEVLRLNTELTQANLKLNDQSKSLRKTKYDLSTRENENRRLSACFSKGSGLKEQNDLLVNKLNLAISEKMKLEEDNQRLKENADKLVCNFLFLFPLNSNNYSR